MGDLGPPNTWFQFLGSTRVNVSIGTLTISDIFVGLTVVTNRQTDTTQRHTDHGTLD